MPGHELSPAALAFDSIAEGFDARFTPWLSVAAQRRAVREELAMTFAPRSRLIELGGGTGDDALWMAGRGHQVLMTDPSPAMVRVAAAKFAGRSALAAQVAPAEDLASAEGMFDGAWSTFAGLNCVTDLAPVARGLARLLRPGASAMLVLFGTCCPGEMLVEGLRGRPRNMFRRAARGAVPARLNGHHFSVAYHRRRDLVAAFAPWFMPAGRQGIGVFVPPSAAEPWISRHPRLLALLEALDDTLGRPLAVFGDHILYRFVRTEAVA
jgi:SAM-dependent methyltransferase